MMRASGRFAPTSSTATIEPGLIVRRSSSVKLPREVVV
jgi:hypothetical protein